VEQGLLPACADNVCPAHCIYFGDPKELGERLATRGGLTEPAPKVEE
jgi:hypothetical protein